MNALTQLSAICGLTLVSAAGTYLVKGPPARLLVCDPATLKPDEICLQSIPANPPVLWVDARLRKDWQESGVPGSLLWNLDPTEDMQAFEAAAAARLMEAPRVIVYCGDENCGVSRQVAQRIRAMGLAENIHVLHGGWRALKEAGRTKDSNPATSD